MQLPDENTNYRATTLLHALGAGKRVAMTWQHEQPATLYMNADYSLTFFEYFPEKWGIKELYSFCEKLTHKQWADIMAQIQDTEVGE